MLMTPEEFCRAMEVIANNDEGYGEQHTEADELMCQVLRDLGYEDGVKVFEDMFKVYW